MVIVDHAPDFTDSQGKVDQKDGTDKEKVAAEKRGGGCDKEKVAEKRGGWMSSWFGAPRKQAKTSDEQDGRSEHNGAEGTSDESPKEKRKCEHVVVPNKGKLLLFGVSGFRCISS